MQISGYDVIKKMRFLEHFLLETELVINKQHRIFTILRKNVVKCLECFRGPVNILMPGWGALGYVVFQSPPPPACNQFSVVLSLYSVSGD